MQANLTREILDLGDAMLAAAHAGDYEALVAAAHQREAVIEQMKAAGFQPDPTAVGSDVQVQHDAIMDELLARERELGETLGGMQQFRSAQQRYVQRKPRRRFLKSHLHG